MQCYFQNKPDIIHRKPEKYVRCYIIGKLRVRIKKFIWIWIVTNFMQTAIIQTANKITHNTQTMTFRTSMRVICYSVYRMLICWPLGARWVSCLLTIQVEELLNRWFEWGCHVSKMKWAEMKTSMLAWHCRWIVRVDYCILRNIQLTTTLFQKKQCCSVVFMIFFRKLVFALILRWLH